MTDVREIVEALFTNGSGEKADRLVLVQEGVRGDLGGWCREAVEDQLKAALSPQAAGYERKTTDVQRRGIMRWSLMCAIDRENDARNGAFADEVRALANDIAACESALAASQARVTELEEAIRWALGEVGGFSQRGDGDGAYWWRSELRARAALRQRDEEEAQP